MPGPSPCMRIPKPQGTLNGTMGAMTEDDDAVRRALRRFELIMVEEVARNASVVAQNTAAAKKSASDASICQWRQPMRKKLIPQALARGGVRRATHRLLDQYLSAGQRHPTKATEASKSAALQRSSTRRPPNCRCPRASKHSAAASQQSAAASASHCDDESVEAATSARDAARLQRGGKISETNASTAPAMQPPRQQRQEIPRGGKNVRRAVLSVRSGTERLAAAGSET